MIYIVLAVLMIGLVVCAFIRRTYNSTGFNYTTNTTLRDSKERFVKNPNKVTHVKVYGSKSAHAKAQKRDSRGRFIKSNL